MRKALVAGAVALTISFAVTGCGPDGPTKGDTGLAVGAVAGGLLGNTVGRGGGRAAATIVGAVVGGIVGSEIGRSMDRQDRILAERAEFDAFERGPSGRPHRWQNPDNGRYGEVVPMAPYRRGDLDCRDYTHTIYIDGRPQAMRGTACRNPDGTWRNVG
jgi:surface antigen